MSQVPDDAGAMLVRLCIFGPVIYAALLMTIDPAQVITFLSRMAAQISHLESHQWKERLGEADSMPVSQGMQIFVRFAGVALTLFGLLHLLELVPRVH